MEGKITILIVDTNHEFYDVLVQALSNESHYDIIGLASDRKKAMQMIKALKPDIIIIDLVLPELDGIGVIEAVNNLKPDDLPIFLVKPSFSSKYVEEVAVSLGVYSTICKPIDTTDLVTLLRRASVRKRRFKEANLISEPDNTHTIDKAVSRMLLELGISSHVKGYQYLHEAIVQTVHNEDVMRSLSKLLYPPIAHKYLTIPSVVEASIRHIIQTVWENISKETYSHFFGGTSDNISSRPTNSEFIRSLAAQVRACYISNEHAPVYLNP